MLRSTPLDVSELLLASCFDSHDPDQNNNFAKISTKIRANIIGAA